MELIQERIRDLKMFVNTNRLTSGLVLGVLLILLFGGFFIFKSVTTPKKLALLEDINLNFDPEGTYAMLTPRSDGNALVLDITRIAQFDAFAYQITYTDDKGIDRGAGSLDTWIDLKNKGDYEQEILLGTCSQGFTAGGAHCVFDTGVENGTLVLRVKKGNQPYKMLSQWHLQKPDTALGVLTSGDAHFTYKMTAKPQDLALIGFSIVNDLSGAPKLPEGKQVFGKVYSLAVPSAKNLMPGGVSLEEADTPPMDAKIALYSSSENKWNELNTKIAGSKLTTEASGSGIFAVLVNTK